MVVTQTTQPVQKEPASWRALRQRFGLTRSMGIGKREKEGKEGSFVGKVNSNSFFSLAKKKKMRQVVLQRIRWRWEWHEANRLTSALPVSDGCFRLVYEEASWISTFCPFLCARKMATASASVADIRPWQLSQPREQLRRPSWVEQVSFSAVLPCGRHYYSPHKMAEKNHRLSWQCRFKLSLFSVHNVN